ncbi:DNA cross-link repair 1A protein-like [Ylistrum balloti]|uniref:DNA cross-link repair 1A protein-like n=1 Tax=Ylistrum balloti TaxID=509963 RepID=UPI002905A2F7|nr:DNA cross-link repair 1A protein-like [Ylistrum balloti]
MKRSVVNSSKDDDSDDEIWGYKCLKREKRDQTKDSQNDKKSQSQFSRQNIVSADRTTRQLNKNIRKKAEEKKSSKSSKQVTNGIKIKSEKSEVTDKHSRKNEKTPSKNCRPELLEGFCPHCQVPYAALSFKSPTWHINECLDRDMAINECPAGLSCDNTLPSHYWKFSHWQLARLRGSGQKTATTTTILDSCKDQQSSSHVNINLLDGNRPGHSRNEGSEKYKTCDITTVVSGEESSNNIVTVTSAANHNKEKNSCESDEEKGMDEMLVDTFDGDSDKTTGLSSSPCSVSTDKEAGSSKSNNLAINIHSDEGISFSPLSSPRAESPASTKSFSQGRLVNYFSINNDMKQNSSSPTEKGLPFTTPTKSMPSLSGKKTRKSTVKKNSGNDMLETDDPAGNKLPKVNQQSVQSFFKSKNAKKALFEKLLDDTSSVEGASSCVLKGSDCEQVASVINVKRSDLKKEKDIGTDFDDESQTLVEKDSDTHNILFDTKQHRNERLEESNSNDCDGSRMKEQISGRSNIKQECVTKENTEKSQTIAKNNKNAFSILMDQTKSKITRQSTTPQSQVSPGKVDAMAMLMKAKQWGKDRNRNTTEESSNKSVPVQSTSAGNRSEGNSVDMRIPQPEKKQWGGQRQCPFYKKMPGTGITVDAFSFGTIPECSAYFLSHFHADHYRGLTKKFKHPVYCSKITANLVERRLKVDQQYLHALPMACPTVVEGVEVTLLEANHCPGSVLFLFKLKGGRIYLHTGDFRACIAMESYPALNSIHINQLYLDTTYCDPTYTFPPQQEVIDFAVSVVKEKLKENAKTLVVCGSYTIGKERIFTAIANALNSKICVTEEKKTVLDCLEDRKLQESITLSPSKARVHVLQMGKLNPKTLGDYMANLKSYTEVIAFEPTGWTHSNKITSLDQLRPKFSRNGIHIYGVPYSEHSSYLEMKRFTQFIKPDKILPTVNNGNSRARTKMEKLFKSWMEELKINNKNQNLHSTKQGTLKSWMS